MISFGNDTLPRLSISHLTDFSTKLLKGTQTAAAGGPVCAGAVEGGAEIGFPANLPGK